MSDRNNKFVSYFRNTLWRLFDAKLLFSTFHHLKIDGHTKVINKTLGSIIRTLVTKNLKYWELKLCHTEFAYNKSASYAIKFSPFESIYGVNPFMHITLIDLPKNDRIYGDARKQVEALIRIHQQVQNNIQRAKKKYK